MSIVDDMYHMGIGLMSSMQKSVDEWVKNGKITEEEAKKLFEDLKNHKKTDEKITPLSLTIGFATYMRERTKDLLDELEETGKLTSEEAKKYYEKYIPEQFRKAEKEEKHEEYVTKDEFKQLMKKLESIEKKLGKE